MSAISSALADLLGSRTDPRAPSRRVGRMMDLGLFVFSVVMLVAMSVNGGHQTIPYHLLFLMLVLVYGFRVWPLGPTMLVLALITASTAGILYRHFQADLVEAPEMAEIVLMPMLTLAMVWHARRRIAALEALQAMADHQELALQRERDFFRNAAHAIRTPVTIARGHLELSQETPGPAQTHEDVAVALRQLDRMSQLSNRLLALAQLESGQEPPLEHTSLQSLVVELGLDWSTESERVWTVACPEDACILVNPDWLRLALDALVENAVHFTADGGRIAVTGEVTSDRCVIRVADDGPGVPAQDLGSVFDRFWHRRPPNGPMGSGLGLPMALATARAFGGTVRASRSVPRGAVFEVQLPVCVAHPDVTPADLSAASLSDDLTSR